MPIRWELIRDPLGRFAPQALLCTMLDYSPEQVLRWFVQRWQLEVTFREEGNEGKQTEQARGGARDGAI